MHLCICQAWELSVVNYDNIYCKLLIGLQLHRDIKLTNIFIGGTEILV